MNLIIFLGPHTIVISYNPEPTIPGASFGQCHTFFPLCSSATFIVDVPKLITDIVPTAELAKEVGHGVLEM